MGRYRVGGEGGFKCRFLGNMVRYFAVRGIQRISKENSLELGPRIVWRNRLLSNLCSRSRFRTIQVPTHYYRIMAVKSELGVETLAVIVPNQEDLKQTVDPYVVSIQKIEDMTVSYSSRIKAKVNPMW